jgi:membrane protease YdiL (CAAX protease family)
LSKAFSFGSFGLVPIAEELLARGYVQTRLAEDFGAIRITAIFFSFSHTQYFIAGPLGVGMLAALLTGSIAAGYVRHRSGSVLPVIIAHAFGNLAFRGWVEPAILGVLVLVIALWARPIYRYVVQLWSEVIVRKAVTAAPAAASRSPSCWRRSYSPRRSCRCPARLHSQRP